MFESCLCLGNCLALGLMAHNLNSVEVCHFKHFFIFFINLCNRLVTVGIVIYRYILPFLDNYNKSCYLRYVFVMKSFLVGTPQKRRLFCSLIIFSILSISLALSLFAVYYEEKNLHFLGTCLILKYTTIDLINFLVWVGI